MYTKKSLFPLFFLLWLSNLIYAQDSSMVVNLVNPDFSKFDNATFRAVNKLRNDIKIEPLLWDEVLFRAAKDHADYLLLNKTLSHFQNVKGKKTTTDRVKVHGGISFTIVGENIVEIPIGVQFISKGVKYNSVSYESSAYTMAELWKHSKGHYDNIKKADYNYTAVATAYDSVSQKLIAVQVFGYSSSVVGQNQLPDYSIQLLSQEDLKLPFKLKPGKHSRKTKKAVSGFLNMSLDAGCLIGSFKAAKKIFRGRRSGIVQEYIPLSQFKKKSTEYVSVPNRRNGLYELNGRLVRPVYRRELLKYSRKNTLRGHYKFPFIFSIKKPTRVFKYPLLPNDTGYEFNLFLVKSRRLEMFRTYIMVPAELFEPSFPALSMVHSFAPLERVTIVKTTIKIDTSTIKVYYKSNQEVIDSVRLKELVTEFDTMPGKIINVVAQAFASVEGERVSNNKLAVNRMNNFMSMLKFYMDTSNVAMKINTAEQWKLFYAQINGTKFHFLKKKKIDEIRVFVNENSKDSLLTTILDKERYIEIKLIWRYEVKDTLPLKPIPELYDSLVTVIKTFQVPDQKLMTYFEKVQSALYHKFSMDTNAVNVPEVPNLEKYPQLKYHRDLFLYLYKDECSDTAMHDKFKEYSDGKYFPARLRPQLVYNNQVLLYENYRRLEEGMFIDNNELYCYKYRNINFNLRYYKNENCSEQTDLQRTLMERNFYVYSELPALIASGKRLKIENFPERELFQFYYASSLNNLVYYNPLLSMTEQYLVGFKKYFHPVDSMLTDKERIKYAYYYCAFRKYSMAKKLVEPIAIRNMPNIEGLKLYVVLKYDEFKEEHAYIDYLIQEYPRLGKMEWCDLFVNPNYFNFLYLEDLKLKHFYNCNCE